MAISSVAVLLSEYLSAVHEAFMPYTQITDNLSAELRIPRRRRKRKRLAFLQMSCYTYRMGMVSLSYACGDVSANARAGQNFANTLRMSGISVVHLSISPFPSPMSIPPWLERSALLELVGQVGAFYLFFFFFSGGGSPGSIYFSITI